VRDGSEETTLGEVVSFKGGGTPSTNTPSYWNGDIPWVSPKDMKFTEIDDSIDKITPEAIKNSAASLIPKNAVLIVVRSGILARTVPVAVTTRPLAVNQDLKALCPKQDVDAHYLHYFMQMSEPEILRLVTRGATVHRLSTDSLKALKFFKPPLAEQQRTVVILDQAFAGLATAELNAEKNLENVRELFDSVSQSLLQPKSEDWQRLSLETLLERGWIVSHLDGNHGNDYPRKEEFLSSGVPYLSANCIENDSVNMSLAKFLSPKRAASMRKGVAHNKDVLFAHNATVGPVAMLYTDEPRVILSTSLTYYRCNPDQIVPEFLAHYMRSPVFTVQYDAVMRQSTRNQVPITKQREFFHIIPPVDEQRKIAGKLDILRDEVNRLEAIYLQKLLFIKELKRSILQQALSGNRTSPPNNILKEAAE
jgi:type I restriction enzyme S subunit